MSEFATLTPLAAAQATLDALVEPIERTERLALERADGRVAAETVTAERAIPHYERAAMDGYAVRATDTTPASERTPIEFAVGEHVGPDACIAVDTGAVVPDSADAVLPVEATGTVENDASDAILVAESVPPGANVGPVGEDVAVGDTVVDAGERMAPAHLGLLRGVGVASVDVYDRPSVALVPTGEELVAGDPQPGEIVETNSLVIDNYVRRWGASVRRHEPVTDDPDAIINALEGMDDADVVVTLGGTSVGERDVVPEAVETGGRMAVHGVGFRPGHPVGFGTFGGTPVVTLPGYPVGCLVAAHLLLRRAVARAGNVPVASPPTTDATLERKIASDLGTRTYARVALSRGEGDAMPVATPIRTKGSGVLSSVTDADGWLVVGESAEGIPAGEAVAVEHWDACPPDFGPQGGVQS